MLNLILDLDNTIYPVSSIGEKLFAPLFELLKSSEYHLQESVIENSKKQIMRIPFQKVAAQFDFPDELTDKALNLLRGLTYDEPMTYFKEYELIRDLDTTKFLLTTGFKNLQQSKISSLKIRDDFTEIFVIDPDKSEMTKKDAMVKIMDKYQLQPADLFVIGDDPESEIKAAKELGMASFLLDTDNNYPNSEASYIGKSLKDVLNYVG
jgi:putative hydrolase of the HAD superfamily